MKKEKDAPPVLRYAVGDVHGMYSLLQKAVAAIVDHANDRLFECVFLGDYVDRGPQSPECVELIKQLTSDNPSRWKALFGNHEDMMLRHIAGQREELWLDNGGQSTYDQYRKAGQIVLHEHVEWLAKLPLTYETEHHLFVHAGIDPDLTIAKQPRNVLIWIRQWQRAYERAHEAGHPKVKKHVVYGHSPTHDFKPILYKHSTGIDLGACFGGRLGVAVFDPKMAKSSAPHEPTRIMAFGE